MSLNNDEIAELALAKRLLENPGLAVRMSSLIGMPIEQGLKLLPSGWNANLAEITRTALTKAAEVAIFTLKDQPGEASSNRWHKLGAAACGGVGGFLGIAGIAAELPISTTIMLRSIADVARSEGASIADIATKVACLEVFALGGSSPLDDNAESGYFAVRSALASSVTDATQFIARNGFSDAPLLIKLISKIADKFGIHVTEKVAVQAIPAIGAAGGAIINTLFIDHFQDMARGHFIVKRLEKKHGMQSVRACYSALP